ncbi:hypothetical protein ACLOJK_004650, partial [Asimina triloba]
MTEGEKDDGIEVEIDGMTEREGTTSLRKMALLRKTTTLRQKSTIEGEGRAAGELGKETALPINGESKAMEA